MAKVTLPLLFLLAFLYSTGQIKDAQLSQIKTIDQAEAFVKKSSNADTKIVTIRAKEDTAEILKSIYKQKPGFTFKIGNLVYKILAIDSVFSFRASYIYLNGASLTKPQIDSLRKLIIAKYKAGEYFIQLAAQYNMDGNPTGDTGWFPEERMVPGFEMAVRNHKKGDIFTVDTPEQNWYHVVLKTHDNTWLKDVTLLQARSGN